ncbi:glycosyltransferase [Alkalihalobacterium chitinilyticum]|uniref:Glycosyltransferase n=1 Tax=Alkalihalobacterium chitinilyticum TaxID=2980103 RepID=A0ABT5VEN0_9BACI|nr:glycosyltransferase [Alkalihalobacterium chitinilyticum]MDE5413792.1 glycosyltransferase [Alkalihalobacterium chitinilyticum]
MKKKILIASFDMEVGGVERSLISMLENFNYDNYQVDLMLYRHQGDFMNLIPEQVNLLPEIPQYATFRKSINEVIKEKRYAIGTARLLSKLSVDFYNKKKKIAEPGYYQMQLMWKYALPFLPRLTGEYDAAISYLWPHDFVAEKVTATQKIAWIHTDFSTIETDIHMDIKIWDKCNNIVAVSDACKIAFINKYPVLNSKVEVIENITSPLFIKKMANENIANPMKNDKRFKIITVARLSHAKGIDNAVKALNKLKDKGLKDIAWYVVGYGGDEAMIKSLIKENHLEDSFILLGKQTNPYPFIKEADIYVQPSRYEGKAVTVTEAMILSKPILITNYSTARSQVNDNVDGVICELSIDGIATGIERLIESKGLREKLKNNLTQKEFSNRDELNKLYSLINKNIDRKVKQLEIV